MSEENITQEFKLKTIDETRNYIIEEINRNELMSKKDKNVCITLNYIKHFLILASAIPGCVSISLFGSLGLKIWAITAGIKKYRSMIKKIEKKSMM